jgi:hypothetical protein
LFLRYIAEHDKSKTRWDHLETGPFVFWYRGSPRPLAAYSSSFMYVLPIVGFVFTDDPPLDVSGMTLVKLNPLGRLRQLIAVPPQVEQPAVTVPSPDWARLFSAAGLDPSKWASAQPAWTPPVYSDARAAWTGSLAERPDLPMRIEAAAYRGKPVYFQLIGPWTFPDRMQRYRMTAGELAFSVTAIVLFLSMLVGGAMLARRNLRLGRGDRRGASRLAACVFVAEAVVWFFGAHHVAYLYEFALFLTFLGFALVFSSLFWVLYIALEPYVRRRWPATLVSWSRLLAGGFRDPLVGRDVLAGCLVGALLAALRRLVWFVPSWLGDLPAQPLQGPDWQFLGARAIIASTSNNVIFSVLISFFFLFVLFFLRALLRKQWLAAVAFVLFTSIFFTNSASPNVLVQNLIFAVAIMFLLIRLGFLAMVAQVVFEFCLLDGFPLTTQGSAWYAGISVAGILLMAAMAFYGFHTSLGGRPVFGNAVLEE